MVNLGQKAGGVASINVTNNSVINNNSLKMANRNNSISSENGEEGGEGGGEGGGEDHVSAFRPKMTTGKKYPQLGHGPLTKKYSESEDEGEVDESKKAPGECLCV